MGRYNWSCNQCGMSSGRRYSIERHIRTLHGGNGSAIRFEEYLIGRRNGIFQPKQRWQGSSTDKFINRVGKAIDDELMRQTVQKAVLDAIKDPLFVGGVKMMTERALNRRIKETLKSDIID